jgi:hypothetical protein
MGDTARCHRHNACSDACALTLSALHDLYIYAVERVLRSWQCAKMRKHCNHATVRVLGSQQSVTSENQLHLAVVGRADLQPWVGIL